MEINTGKKQNPSLSALMVLIFAILILGILIVALIRSNSSSLYSPSRPAICGKDSSLWFESVCQNNETQAVYLAEKMVPDDLPELPNPDYIDLMIKNRLGTLILTSPFNKFDFLRWRDAVEIQKIVKTLDINTDEDKIESIFKVMKQKVQLKSNIEKDYKVAVSIIDIWNKKTCSTQELCRLFSALAWQAGYDVQVISLFSETGKQMHVFCEVRKNSKSYIVDPRFGFVEENASADLYAGESTSLPKIWPANIAACIQRRLYQLPAEAMDYKLTNQQLQHELSVAGLTSPPKFGVDPQSQIDEYRNKYPNKIDKSQYTYWNFPFISLMSSPEFPEDWKLKFRKSIQM